MNKLPKHLGGHANITHIDEGALIYLKHRFNAKLFMDVGCGVGGMIMLANKHGMISVGIDGDDVVKRHKSLDDNIIINDYTKSKIAIQTIFDVAWSVEFLEHVEEKYLYNVFDTFNKSKIVFCTANANGGHHHVNRQPVEYWIGKFREWGFEFLRKETEEIKIVSTMKRNFVQETGMIFRNIKL